MVENIPQLIMPWLAKLLEIHSADPQRQIPRALPSEADILEPYSITRSK